MKESEKLTDGYVKNAILKLDIARAVGLTVSDVTPEMIRLKRSQLKLYREVQRARQVLNEKN
jgi:hypothetical protein